MADTLVTGLVVTLFLLVAGLLAYGLSAFRAGDGSSGLATATVQVSTRREVLWTGLSAGLLLAVFVFAR